MTADIGPDLAHKFLEAHEADNEDAYSGFFWNDSIPVYIVHERKTPDDKIWQVVFLPGVDGKISDVRIQNNRPPPR